MEEEKKSMSFPKGLFCVYLIFFSGQAIYNTYLNLYLAQIGFSTTQIGSMISISTIVLLIAQTFWGSISDRAERKNGVLPYEKLLACVIPCGCF
jgi:PPP family 3-phenylpropionic acid transporter